MPTEDAGGDPGGFRLDEALAPPRDRRLRDLPGLVRRAVALVIAAAKKEFLITAALQTLSSAGLAVQLLIARRLLVHILAGKQHGFGPVVPDVIALGAAVGVVGVANAARAEIQRTLGVLVARYAMAGVIDVSRAVELIAFESPAFHDRQQRALVNASARPLQMTTGLIALIGSLLGVVAVGAALLTIQPLLLLAAIAAIVPLWLATVAASRAMYDYAVEQTELDRRRFYVQMLLTNRETAKEIRAYDTGAFLRGRFDDLYDRHVAALKVVVRQRTRQGVIGAIATALLTGGTLALLVWFLSTGLLSVAGAGAAAGGIILLGTQMQGLTSGIGNLYESSLFIRDFNSFVASLPAVMARRGGEAAPETFSMIQARDVSFTYPSRPRPSLRNIDVELRQGEVVALVGENGSGKTTLAKILAGLYRPDSGSVLWDGVDVSSFDPSELSRRTAVLFQDFVRYHMTAKENIAMGNEQLFDDDTAVEAAARLAGAHEIFTALAHGYETLLGPEYFGGVDLSVGQWQRVALARAFLRDARLIILDEPTAAMDPRSEADLFQTVRELFAGRTVLLISHRYATVRLADRIYVLDQGIVVEHGSHDQLVRMGGRYAQSFALQASAFGSDTTPLQGRRRRTRWADGAAGL